MSEDRAPAGEHAPDAATALGLAVVLLALAGICALLGGHFLLGVLRLAAGVLAPIGFVLSPAVGAILMSASTIVVALNAQLLRRINLDPGHLAPLGAPRPEAALQPATS